MNEPRTPLFRMKGEMLMQITQSLLEAKKMSRSVENTVEALLPFTDSQMVINDLHEVSRKVSEVSVVLSRLYAQTAREATKETDK